MKHDNSHLPTGLSRLDHFYLVLGYLLKLYNLSSQPRSSNQIGPNTQIFDFKKITGKSGECLALKSWDPKNKTIWNGKLSLFLSHFKT